MPQLVQFLPALEQLLLAVFVEHFQSGTSHFGGLACGEAAHFLLLVPMQLAL